MVYGMLGVRLPLVLGIHPGKNPLVRFVPYPYHERRPRPAKYIDRYKNRFTLCCQGTRATCNMNKDPRDPTAAGGLLLFTFCLYGAYRQ